ncbi:MFS general substrate transporter [Myriangium duriaei CBS 260.36]|uniref:Cercosporin MFS transporter CTB4 n=1 Tax=Myriangium duriaei CBS 260.36 TaxID=1168546 RepID=A0A9P4J2U7_9PEZI|nr:MFS general substrate transporter [Myriangium duriaei CBS 260.36]
MYEAIRESAYGQAVRWATGNKYFKYEEELEGFHIPWQTATSSDERATVSAPINDVNTSSSASSSQDTLERIKTEKDDAQLPGVQLTRTKSRQDTTPFSSERFDVEQQLALERPESRVIVPQKTADGVILVDWYTTDDQANPQNWSTKKKVYVSFVVAIYTLVVYASSAIYTSAQEQVMAKFGLSFPEGSAILSLYVAGYGLGPLLFSPLSEIPVFGRNIPYVISFALFVILSVPTALVDNYPGLLVLRFLTGFMGSPCLATGGASMGDMFSLIKLPYALTAWVAAAFCAPAIGPLLSGFAVPVLGWRWAFWEILIMSGPVWMLWFVTLPETSPDNILLRRAQRLRKLTGNPKYMSQSEISQANKKFSSTLYQALLVPFMITIKDPAVLFTNLFTSILYGIYYGFFEAFPLTYIGIYHFNIGQLGIVYVTCFTTGAILGIGTYVAYQWFYLEPDMRKRGPRAQEHRLVPALISVWLLPIALFWFGWTADPNIHWVVSIIGLVFFGYGAFVLFQCVFMYLPLTYPRYAASLFAANDAFRSAFAAGSIIYAHPMYVNLGIGRGVSILGGLTVGGCFGMIALYYFGASLRAKSKFSGM